MLKKHYELPLNDLKTNINTKCYQTIVQQIEARMQTIQNGVLEISYTRVGFFACCTVKLISLYIYILTFKTLPKQLICNELFSLYQSRNKRDLNTFYFLEKTTNHVEFLYHLRALPDQLNCDWSWGVVKNLPISDFLPLVERYFTPSHTVDQYIKQIENKYFKDYSNVVGVYYRGLDKTQETDLSSYDNFIKKAEETLLEKPNSMFFVQTDEQEFREAFLKKFPNNSFYNESMPVKSVFCSNSTDKTILDKGMHHENTLKKSRPAAGVQILSTAIILSKCRRLILSVSNVSVWTVLYRGNLDGVCQWNKNSWYI